MALVPAGSGASQHGGAVKRMQPGQVTRVAIRDGKTISINDYIYVTTAWAPGAGEPYLIARVMEFVTTASSRNGGASLTGNSGTLQVRANYFLRMRDISHRISSDSRLLVATMHCDLLALDNVRGLCEVRHRELIGEAPEVGAWKKRDDHFYYHQFFDRYAHRFYDVVPTWKLQNAPAEVLSLLRKRYSFILAEPGVSADLCDALRGCLICHQWASGPESVRCDVCKKYFHMRCVTPPLTSKPAKGYGWTCAPCYRRHEQTVALESGGLPPSLSSSSSASTAAIEPAATGTAADGLALPAAGSMPEESSALNQQYIKARLTATGSRGGRPRNSGARRGLDSDSSFANTPEGSPAPEKTLDDVRGVRCTNGWNYRYFGQHTDALDVLDPHDSIYPRATTRHGSKFQTEVPTWEQQQEMGLGVPLRVEEGGGVVNANSVASGAAGGEGVASSSSLTVAVKKPRGRPKKSAVRGVGGVDRGTPQGGTPVPPAVTLTEGALASERGSATPAPVATLTPVREFERGTDESIDVICNLCHLSPKKDPQNKLQLFEAYMASAAFHFKPLPPYNVDFMVRAVQVYSNPRVEPIAALSEVSTSSAEDFRIVHWTQKERKAFDTAVRELGLEMRQIKRLIPTKKPSDIVRYYATWKNERMKEAHEAEKLAIEKAKGKGKMPTEADPEAPASTRAVSPALSLFDEKAMKEAPINISCKMCSTHESPFWYKGPYAWPNRFLCSYCGLYWRKYAAEASHTDLIATNPRKHPSSSSAEAPAGLGVAPPVKVAKLRQGDSARSGAAGRSSSGAASAEASSPAAVPVAIAKLDPIRCVMCRRLEPKKKLQQCRQCSLSVHQGCFGLTDAEVAAEVWTCEPCTNEKTLDAGLVPKCILCPLSDGSVTVAAQRARGGAVTNGNGAKPATNGSGFAGSAATAAGSEALNALDAFKPTECNNWAHLICAAWMPDVVFTDAERMKLVEGAGHLPLWRYSAVCEICNTGGTTEAVASSSTHGACLQCSDASCRRTFHVSCAFQNSGYSLGFEINPVKISRRDAVSIATFKAETGHWTALAYCKAHRDTIKDKATYDFSEVDPKTGATALQTYVKSHKSIFSSSSNGQSNGDTSSVSATASAGTGATVSPSSSVDQTYALLRRAKRFDVVLSEVSNWTIEARIRAASGELGMSPTPAPQQQQQRSTPAASLPKTEGSSQASLLSHGRSHLNGGTNGSSVKPARRPMIRESIPPPYMSVRKGPGMDDVMECLACGSRLSPFWWPLPSGKSVPSMPGPGTEEGAEGCRVYVAREGDVCCNICREATFAYRSTASVEAEEREEANVP